MSEPAKVIDGEVEPKAKAVVAKRKTEIAAEPASERASMLAMIERASRDTTVDIVKMKELFTMHRQMEAWRAECAFNAAMANAQSELEPVVRNRPNKQTGSNYADLAAIAEAALPTIHAHGFGIICSEFKSERPECLGVACKVTHAGGHSERYEFNVPLDGTGMKGNPNKTATHAYGSSLSYGRRYATCGVFNLATKDDDGNKASSDVTPITEPQLQQLQAEIVETGADIPKFTRYFKIEQVADLPATRFQEALALLDNRRKAQI